MHTLMYICMILYSLQASGSQPCLHIGIAGGAVKYPDAWESPSIWAAVIKYQRLGDLNTEIYLLNTVLEAGKSKIKVPADSVSDMTLLLVLQMAGFLLCPHQMGRRWGEL